MIVSSPETFTNATPLGGDPRPSAHPLIGSVRDRGAGSAVRSTKASSEGEGVGT
jgi:hypothetical protein